MAAFAELSGVRVVSGSISIPLYGLWCGDVRLATEEAIQTNTTLVLGNLTLRCNVYRQALFAGARNCRIVAGYGGWRQTVPAKQYSLSSGVRLGMVVRDAASEVGERVNVPADVVLGTGYVRENARASRVLRQVAGQNWYCDKDGVTQIAAWPTRKVPSEFQVMEQDGGRGKIGIATEDYASWLPGCTFTSSVTVGTLTNAGVLYSFANDGKFRLEVLTSP